MRLIFFRVEIPRPATRERAQDATRERDGVRTVLRVGNARECRVYRHTLRAACAPSRDETSALPARFAALPAPRGADALCAASGSVCLSL